MGTEVGPVKALQAQTLVLTQVPHVLQALGAVCEGVACPPPQPLAAAPVVPAMAAQVFGGTWAYEGGWPQGLPPPALPAPHPAPMMAPRNACPWPQGTHGEGSQAPSQAKAQPDDSCNPKSVYENFRLWQRYKPLARRHLPQSPDMEALSCFFMFLEFEAEEKIQIQKSQWMKVPQCLPPPALPRLEPQGLSTPEVVKEPVYLPSKAGPKALPACHHSRDQGPSSQQRPRPPRRFPAEVVQEYVDIMEELLGPPIGATGELEGQREEGKVEQEKDRMFSDPYLLSYVDNLCSQKDFITKVEVVIHPQFLEELLSPDSQMDFLALSQELEQEEGLTLAQVAEKRLLYLKEERCARAAPSHGSTQPDSISSESAAGQGAERDVPGPQQGVSMETCPPQTTSRDPQGQGRERTGMVRSKIPVVLLERLDSHWLRAARANSPPQDHRPTCPGVGTKDTWGLPGASPVKESRRLSKGSSEEEREILGIVSVVLRQNYRLRPWKLSQSPVPASGLLNPEGWGPQGALQSQSAKRRGLSAAPAPATKSKKQALFGGPSPAEQMPHLGPGLRVSGAQSLAWGLGGPSQSQKRKGDPLLSKRKKTQHCSQ
uniref:Nuclear Testis protein N-terminal domain-containing protein n=1 Tax=Callithrix jacchus TaxID=9483 RepID=A0A5F4W5U4_CALJA